MDLEKAHQTIEVNLMGVINTVQLALSRMINNGGGHIVVAEQFLDCSNIASRFQQMGGKRMAQGVNAHMLGDPGGLHRLMKRLLKTAFMDVMPRHSSISWIVR